MTTERSSGPEVWLAPPEAAEAFDPSILAGVESARWLALRTPRRKRDFAASRTLMRSACARDERPMSLSHSHGYAALAAGEWPGRVGVDLEYMRDRDFAALADLAFPVSEAQFVASKSPGDARRCAFYELWTLKEACAKALDLPLADALQSCRFVDLVDEAFHWHPAIPWEGRWQAIVFKPAADLCLAVMFTGESRSPTPFKTVNWPSRPVNWAVTANFCNASSSVRA